MRAKAVIRRRATALWLVALLGATSALAAAPVWTDLSNQEQALIGPALLSQKTTFDALPEARRSALAAGARKWLGMNEQQRAIATRQLQEWQAMSPAEKQAALERRERFRKLSSGEQQSLLNVRRQYLALPDDVKSQLRDQFSATTGLGGTDTLTAPSFSPPATPLLPALPSTTAPPSAAPTINLPH